MISIQTVPLSRAQSARLSAAAAYDRSQGRARIDVLRRANVAFAVLAGGVTALLFGGFLVFGALSDLADQAVVFASGVVVLYGLFMFAALRSADAEHAFLLERKAAAAAALISGEGRDIKIDWSPTDIALPHEHGCIFIASDGEGGARLIDVSAITDDPRGRYSSGDPVPASWRWSEETPGGPIAGFEAKGVPVALRVIDVLDADGEAAFAALGIAFPPDADLTPIAVSIGDIASRLSRLAAGTRAA